MDDLERAVLVVFAQGQAVDPAVRAQANEYCEAVKRRPDCWRYCWEHFAKRECVELRFWCLQVLCQAIPGLPVDSRAELRSCLLAWFRDVASTRSEEVVVKNKVALTYALLLKWDYPANCPTGWRDLVSLLERGPNMVDLFLRVLAVFDQEVVNDDVPRSAEDRQRSQLIKHAMRERDVMHLAENWYNILCSFQASSPQLVIDCLKVIAIYIIWIEILTVANDKFLTAICSLITDAGPAAGEACDCVGAVMSKKMPAAKKVQMLDQLQMLRRFEACVHRNSVDHSLLEKEANLFNSVGEVALEAYVDLRLQADAQSAACAQAAWEFIKALMPSVFWFFSHPEYQIAVHVEPYLTQFFMRVKAFVAGAEQPSPDQPVPVHTVSLDQVRPILMQTLQLIIGRTAFPDWFQHHDPNHEDDDRHIAFLEFRRSLTKIYKRIFLVDETLGFQFVQASIAQLTLRLRSVKPMEAEAVLYLYKEAGEIVKDVGQHLQASGPLATCFVQLCECEPLVQSDHWAVQLGLIELYVRYGRVFAAHPELFSRFGQRVLEAFAGSQGIRAADPRVVTRACFMFSRFLKLAKKQIVPFTIQIYNALKDLMVVQYIPSNLVPVQVDGTLPKVVIKGTLKAEDQACLYEAIASLVSTMPPEQMRPALQMLLKQPADNLTEILSAPPARIATDVRGYASWAARSIEAIATVSKAFGMQHACTAPDWEDGLVAAARILDRFSGQLTVEVGLWRAALFLCRRMVEVLNDQFLGPLDTLLPLLYTNNNQVDLTELTIFAHHIVCQYHKKTQPLLQKWLEVLFLRPFDIWKQMPEESDQFKREKLELGCALLLLLKEAGQRCSTVLLEPMLVPNGGRLGPDLVAFLLQGLTDPNELRALFLAASAWNALLELAVANPATHEAMASLPLAPLLRHLLWSCVRMDFGDVQSQKILGEAASILRSLVGMRTLPQPLQQLMREALQQALVAALPGLRSDLAPRRLCEALVQDAAISHIRPLLQQCAAEWRRECRT